jgi:hypothetical protein
VPERKRPPKPPRHPHPIELRAWALDHSPARLRQIALLRLEVFLSFLGKSLSNRPLSFWRAFLLGVEARADSEHLRRWDESLRKDLTATKDWMTLACITYTFCERFDYPLVCEQPPFWVPVDHIHLFDLTPSQIRAGLADAIKQVESEDISNILGQLLAAPSKLDVLNLARVRPAMDRLVAFLLRFSGGLQIHNPGVCTWIAANAYRARHAIDPRERNSAVRSLENVADALLPSGWTGRGPNEAGLSLEHMQLRNSLAPIFRRKFRHPAAYRLALQEKLPGIEHSVVARVAKSTLGQGVLTVLAHEYSLSEGYLKNLIKKGNLFHKVCAHWSQSLADIPLDDFFPSPV